MTNVVINGRETQADQFGWDGCHKIYLITSQQGHDDMVEYGYTLYPISELQEAWDSSCSLRFISPADLASDNFVFQFEDDEPVIEVGWV